MNLAKHCGGNKGAKSLGTTHSEHTALPFRFRDRKTGNGAGEHYIFQTHLDRHL